MFEAIATAVFLPLLQAPQDGAELNRSYGDSIRLGDGIVRTWVELDGGKCACCYVIRYSERERGFRISLEAFRWREDG